MSSVHVLDHLSLGVVVRHVLKTSTDQHLFSSESAAQSNLTSSLV